MATGPTWAQVVRKKKPTAFHPTECAVNLEQFAAPLHLPPVSSRHSAFVPLPSTYKQAWAGDIVSALPLSALGFVPRADIFLLEVCFAAADAQQEFIANPFVCNHFTAHPLPPAGTPPTFIPIKLVNVPVLSLAALEQAIRSFWSSHGEVVAIAPHIYKGTPFISNRWDLVLKLSGGKTLSATPFFDLCGFKVMASWPGSEKACPRCKLAGHDSHTCPRRPATKASKKRTTSPSQQPAPATPPSTIATAIPATADIADMEEDTPTSDPINFPFQLTPEQAVTLNALTSEQWLTHCQNVRSNHPRTEPEIEHFLSLPIEKIVEVFRGAVQHLVASLPPTDPPTPTPTPSTSIVTPPISVALPTTGIPPCPITFKPDRLRKYFGLSDEEFLSLAGTLKAATGRKEGVVKTFMDNTPVEYIVASIKRAVYIFQDPPINWPPKK